MRVVWGSDNFERKTSEKAKMNGKDLVHYFSEDLFIAKLKAKTKDRSFEEFAELFVSCKLIRRKEIILEMLQKRETLGSTGIGKGIAVPHGRTTAALEVRIAFGRSEKGLDFDAVDGKPVHLIFVVLAPPHDANNRYLPILGKLVEILSEKKYRDQLLAVESYPDFIRVFESAE